MQIRGQNPNYETNPPAETRPDLPRRQMCPEESKPVPPQNVCCVGFTVTTLNQLGSHHLKIGDRIHLMRDRLPAKAAIEIRADPCMQRVPGDLADMVDVRDQEAGNGAMVRRRAQAEVTATDPSVLFSGISEPAS